MNPSSLPKSKMKRTKTKVYVKWVFTKDRASFGKGKEISIAAREKFSEVLENEARYRRVGGYEEKR